MKRLYIFYFTIIATIALNAQDVVYENLSNKQKLYTNFDNRIEIGFSSYDNDEFEFTTNRGTITKQGNLYIFRCKQPGYVRFYIIKDGKTIITQEHYVEEFNFQSLCMEHYLGQKLKADYFLGKIWIRNPIDILDKQEITEITFNLKKSGYSNTLIIKGKKLKNLARELRKYENNRIKIASVKYRDITGKEHYTNNVKPCRCSDYSRLKYNEYIPKKRKTEKKNTYKRKGRLRILQYPLFRATVLNQSEETISKATISEAEKLEIRSYAEGSLFGFEIKSFAVTIIKNDGSRLYFETDSNTFSQKIKEAFNSLTANEIVTFSSIIIKNEKKSINVEDLTYIIQ